MLEIRVETEADRRYRVMIILERSDKPSNWKFHCPKCEKPVCEIINGEMVAISDAIDMENVDNTLIGKRCDGRYNYSERCNTWYYFKLREAK